jgi:hypothetical protein
MKVLAIAFIGVALVLGTASFGQAVGVHGSPGFSGHPHAGHFDGHRFDAHHGFHHFDRHAHGSVIIGAPFYWPPVYPYDEPPAYTYEAPAPSYWYYCQSAGAYYPTVQSCPEAWVPVPAQ